VIDWTEWMAWHNTLPKLRGKDEENENFWREIDAAQTAANNKRTGQRRPQDTSGEE
jgi:hypothetical protein